MFSFMQVKINAYEHSQFQDTLQQNIFQTVYNPIERKLIVQNALKKNVLIFFFKTKHKILTYL